mmetsp:Transcript_5749/g.16969  ORF Transcript_5749/g.16969 Transcript_5749/m.16969 type:complete len:200 (+) Transcript_5749:518-1117(+)
MLARSPPKTETDAAASPGTVTASDDVRASPSSRPSSSVSAPQKTRAAVSPVVPKPHTASTSSGSSPAQHIRASIVANASMRAASRSVAALPPAACTARRSWPRAAEAAARSRAACAPPGPARRASSDVASTARSPGKSTPTRCGGPSGTREASGRRIVNASAAASASQRRRPAASVSKKTSATNQSSPGPLKHSASSST